MKQLALLMLLASPVLAQPPGGTTPATAPLASLVEAERNFARLSVKIGQLPAFLACFADDVVTFQPLPVAGKDGMRTAALQSPYPPARQLDWEPWAAGIASSGDLGFTTGPSLVTEKATGKAVRAGWYFSVWKHDAFGWRVAADIGVQAPGVDALRPSPLDTGSRAAPARAGRGTKEGLLAAEADLAKRVRAESHHAGYARYLAPDARIYRDGAAPVVGGDAVGKALAKEPAPVGWHATFASVSSSGDLGYSYGVYNVPASRVDGAKASFLHVWRAGPNGWLLLAEVVAGAR